MNPEPMPDDQGPPARAYIGKGERREYSLTARLKFVSEHGKFWIELQSLDNPFPDDAEGVTLPTPATPAPGPGWLPMAEAAKHLGMSYSWLAHHWRALGLHPSTHANKRLFRVEELNDLMMRRRAAQRGRPRKKRELDA